MKKYDMLNTHKLTLFTIATLFLSGCWWNTDKSDKKDEDSKLVVINVLGKDYYDDCHIKGSINIPFEDFEEKIKTMDKAKQYVVYCSNYACLAAPHCAKMMKDAGFDKVYVFHAGIVGWHQEEYPCVGEAKMSYLQDTNEKLDDEDDELDEQEHMGIVDISAQELKRMMTEAGLLS